MPLTELSHNQIGRNCSRSVRSDNASHRSDKRLAKASAPDPLQGMLKTTTEIGDVARFAVKPSRIPHPVTRESPRRPDGSNWPLNPHNPGFRRRRSRYQDHPERRHDALAVSKDKVPSRSRSASIHGGDRSTPSPATSHNLSNCEYAYDHRSYSLTQSSQTSYAFSNHRSNVSLKNFGEPHLMRPRSPFAYPTRLKRPGFRPSSPALSQHNGSDHRAAYGLDRGPSFRTSSPSSLYAGRRVPAGFTPDYNQSTPSLPIRLQPERTKHCGARTPPLPTRTAKYVHLLGHDFPAPSVLEQNTVTIAGQRSGGSTQSPRYYDYSEAFEEQGVCYGDDLSEASVPLIDQTIPEDRLPSVQYKFRGPKARETELTAVPLGDSRQPSQGLITLSGRPRVIKAESTEDEKRVHEPATRFGVDVSTRDVDDIKVSSDCPARSFKDQTVNTSISRSGSFGTTVQQSSESPIIVSRSREDSSVSASSNPENLGISSSLISLYQSPAVSESLEKANQVEATEPFPLPVAPSGTCQPQGWTIPSLDFSLMDLAGRPEASRDGSKEHSTSLSGVGEAGYPTIHAPVPRRSLSSQSKFSKILSVDDGVIVTADTLNQTMEEAAERFGTTNPNIKTGSKANLSSQKRSTSRLSIRSLSRMMKLATVGERDMADLDGSSSPKSALVSTVPTAGKLVKRFRHGTETTAALGVGNSVAVDDVPVGHDMSNKLSNWNEMATPPTTERPGVLTANVKNLYPGEAHNPGHTANNESPNEIALTLPADTSFRSISPPALVIPTNLPYSFVPLAPELAQGSNIATPEPAATGIVDTTSLVQDGKVGVATKYRLKIRPNRKSDTSLSGSQPWNYEESYPWTDRHPSIDVRMPAPLTHSQQRHEKPPKFKLKVSRASKINKTTIFQEAEPHKRSGSPSTHFSSCHPTRKHRFGHLISTTRTSTSSDTLPGPSLVIGTPTFRPATSGLANPSLLSPTSPSAEVQSFFSDDSSQVQHKGSIRKRLSELKAKLPASRGASSDEARAMDRLLTRSVMNRSRASGRTSRPSEDGTAGVSNARYTRLKVVEKIKGWWLQGAEKVRGFGGKRKGRDAQAHGAALGVYAGV